jgi:CheY-like chemotaxis protein
MPVASENLSILIIEDNPIDLLLIETYLIENTKNANIIRAKNFQQSKDSFSLNTPFDVILLDLSLPDASGERLIDDVVKLARNTPVIAITGCADKDFSVKTDRKSVV